jgi:hypothetical protein
MWRAMIVALGMGTALALSMPAQAKMVGTAFISGPGIPGGGSGEPGTIRLDGSDGAGYPVVRGLVVRTNRFAAEPPEDDLGPRYTVRFVTSIPRGQPDVIQHLYPFARGGPLMYTPPGQEWLGGPNRSAPDGWYRPSGHLMQELWDRGFPRTEGPPRASDEPVMDQPSGPRSSPVAWGLVLLSGLLVSAAVAGRKRVVARRAA